MHAASWQRLAVAAIAALVLLELLWELWLAPLKPGGSALALKVLPLLLPLFGILRGRIYTYQWSSMLILAYIAEGTVRAYSDSGLSARLAMLETVLAAVYYAGSLLYIRISGRVA